MNGRLILAGHDPSRVTLRHALDAAVALITEGYRTRGWDYFDAIKDATTFGVPEDEKEPEPEIDNDQAMNALAGMMSNVGKKFS